MKKFTTEERLESLTIANDTESLLLQCQDDMARSLEDPVVRRMLVPVLALIESNRIAPKLKPDTSKARAHSARARSKRANQHAEWLFRKCLGLGAVDASGTRLWPLQKIADELNHARLLTRRHKPWNRKTVSRALTRVEAMRTVPSERLAA